MFVVIISFSKFFDEKKRKNSCSLRFCHYSIDNMYLVICVCVFFFHKKTKTKKEKMYRHCHLSLCENKNKKTFFFWRMMQLEILNHHCFVCIKKEEKEAKKNNI